MSVLSVLERAGGPLLNLEHTLHCHNYLFNHLIFYYFSGAERFSNDMKLMLGYRAPVLLRICWCFISPAAVFVVFILLLSRYEPATYEGHPYPDYAINLGFVLALIPVLPIPICFVYGLLTKSGTLSEVC
jgi:hypothetical protein